ncbi:MAG: hypothetical protein ACO3A2_09670 [Bdellovibrionia bacterium]
MTLSSKKNQLTLILSLFYLTQIRPEISQADLANDPEKIDKNEESIKLETELLEEDFNSIPSQKIKAIKPNELALERINQERKQKHLPAIQGKTVKIEDDDYVVEVGSTSQKTDATSLPLMLNPQPNEEKALDDSDAQKQEDSTIRTEPSSPTPELYRTNSPSEIKTEIVTSTGKRSTNRISNALITTNLIEAKTSSLTLTTTPLTQASLDPPLPRSVDNSTLPSFPPIGVQSGGSCLAFADGYYMASHETCLVQKKCNNKTFSWNGGETSGNPPSTVAAPNALFSMTRSYPLMSSNQFNTLSFLEKNGFISMSDWPHKNGAWAQFRNEIDPTIPWPTKAEYWLKALSFRMKPVTKITETNTASGLFLLKQSLTNGHVLVFGTKSDANYSTIGTNPDSTVPSPFSGQRIMTSAKDSTTGHALTVVGYDDDIWTDINANGLVDPGESGALKAANSRGIVPTTNDGFIWIAYDALRSVSSVNGGYAAADRITAMTGSTAFLMEAQLNYTPKLVAQFVVNAAKRSHMKIEVGISNLSETNPSTTWTSGAFSNQGGLYTFDGTVSDQGVDGSFTIDLSSLITSQITAPTKFYLKVSDNTAGYPVILKAFKLFDPINHSHFYYNPDQLPIETVDQSSITKSIIYYPPN